MVAAGIVGLSLLCSPLNTHIQVRLTTWRCSVGLRDYEWFDLGVELGDPLIDLVSPSQAGIALTCASLNL